MLHKIQHVRSGGVLHGARPGWLRDPNKLPVAKYCPSKSQCNPIQCMSDTKVTALVSEGTSTPSTLPLRLLKQVPPKNSGNLTIKKSFLP